MPFSGKSYPLWVIFCMRPDSHSLYSSFIILTRFSYGCSEISRHDLQRLCYRVTEDLFAWKENLPSTLEIDLDNDTVPRLPHLLMLQYAPPFCSRKNMRLTGIQYAIPSNCHIHTPTLGLETLYPTAQSPPGTWLSPCSKDVH